MTKEEKKQQLGEIAQKLQSYAMDSTLRDRLTVYAKKMVGFGGKQFASALKHFDSAEAATKKATELLAEDAKNAPEKERSKMDNKVKNAHRLEFLNHASKLYEDYKDEGLLYDTMYDLLDDAVNNWIREKRRAERDARIAERLAK